LKTVPWLLGVVLGTLSIVTLLQQAFDVGFVEPLEIMLSYYERLAHLLFGWMEPTLLQFIAPLRDLVPWQLTLYPHWKHIFILLALYFLRSATDSFVNGAPVSGLFRGFSGVLMALISSVCAGIIPNDNNIVSDFLIATIPVIGVSMADLGWNAWWAAWLRRPELTLLQDFVRTETYTLKRDAIGIVIAFVGLQLPHVQALPNPGVAVLGFLVVALAAFYIALGVVDANYNRHPGETWYQGFRRDGGARLGLAMLGVIAGGVAFVATNAGLESLGFS